MASISNKVSTRTIITISTASPPFTLVWGFSRPRRSDVLIYADPFLPGIAARLGLKHIDYFRVLYDSLVGICAVLKVCSADYCPILIYGIVFRNMAFKRLFDFLYIFLFPVKPKVAYAGSASAA